ncbi:hypothetical protein AB1Y20_020421 [Prymnesium parvum]|uniref:Uncharacterized protein n=1 Tax=Prymnesium parvum TaxID=97485 RepID=A0AB34JXC3_PRYPA
MIAAPQEEGAAYYSRVVSDGALLQLLICFVIETSRPDPYLVGPLIALYATRESDRRALFLYLIVTSAAAIFELMYLLRGGANGVWDALQLSAQLVLQLVMLYPGLKLHDQLPARRPPRVDPAQLKEHMAAIVQQVLLDQVERVQSSAAARSRDGAAQGADTTSWDEV